MTMPLDPTMRLLNGRWKWSSISNSSRRSHRVRVRARTELSPNRQSGLLIHRNCPFGYSSIDISLTVWIGRDLSGTSSGSICEFIYHTCLRYLTVEINQNRLLDIHESNFAFYLGCEIDNIPINVFSSLNSISHPEGGQWFNYRLKYPCDTFITEYDFHEIHDT
jgi:hypothetical protein